MSDDPEKSENAVKNMRSTGIGFVRKGADDSVSWAIKRSQELLEKSRRLLLESRRNIPPRN